MNTKKIDRRKFLINSIETAAGIGVLASCDKRAIVGPDVRAPSAPVGLSQKVRAQSNASNGTTTYSVNLAWTKHDDTDNTGAKTETQILYNIYRKTDAQTAFDDTPLAAGVQLNSYSDTSAEVQDAFARLQANPNSNISFEYQVRAVDADRNLSLPSDPVLVPIQPFVKVFTVKNTAAVKDTGINGQDKSAVQKMLDAVIIALAQQKNPGIVGIGEAWQSFFPSLSPATLIGIKINTLSGSQMSTKPAVVDAIVNGLKQMQVGSDTFPEYNIIVFDDRIWNDQMIRAGFTVRNVSGMYRIVSTGTNTSLDPSVPDVSKPQLAPLWGDPVSIAGVSQKFSKIVEALDYIINVPVLKDHVQAGITFSMKNLYGLVNAPGNMHASMCSPFIPALYSASTTVNGVPVPIKSKIRVIVGDALAGVYYYGPYNGSVMVPSPCTLIVGTDPVAVDSWALDTINAYRSEMKKWTIGVVPDPNGRWDARHIFQASTLYNLGSMNYDEVKVEVPV